MPVLVKEEHFVLGIEKYNGKRDEELEKLFSNGGMEADVYVFSDGRCLVRYKMLKQSFLYSSKESLLGKITL